MKYAYQRLRSIEATAFGALVALFWLSEGLDLPALLLGAPRTPFNWRESLLYSGAAAAVAWAAVRRTRDLVARVKFLEGMLPMCAACKRVREENGTWKTIEAFLEQKAQVPVTSGLCDDCAHRLYPGFVDDPPEAPASGRS